MSHVLFFHSRKPFVMTEVFNAWLEQGPDVPFFLFYDCGGDQEVSFRTVENLRTHLEANAFNARIVRVCEHRRGPILKLERT